jgi:hypothetical protein
MPAPVASRWSGCRVGLAPTGKRRLVTAHTRSGRSGQIDRCQGKTYVGVHNPSKSFSHVTRAHSFAESDRLDSFDRELLGVDRKSALILTDLLAVDEAANNSDLVFVFPLVRFNT